MNVNISARHFQHEGLVEDVSGALRASHLDPACLVLEITESVLVHDAEAVIARMLELKELGVAFAVDDFGTGYSSLSYLKRFPIDILKVDKSFVDDVGDSDGPWPWPRPSSSWPGLSTWTRWPKASRSPAKPTACAPSVVVTGRASFSPGPSAPTRWSGSCLSWRRESSMARPRKSRRRSRYDQHVGRAEPGRQQTRPSEQARADSPVGGPGAPALLPPHDGRRHRGDRRPAHPDRRPVVVRLRLVQLPRVRPPPRDHGVGGRGHPPSGAPIPAGPGCSGNPRLYVEIEDRLTELLGRARHAGPAHDHAHPYFRDPGAGRPGRGPGRRPGPQDDLRRAPTIARGAGATLYRVRANDPGHLEEVLLRYRPGCRGSSASTGSTA